MWSQFTFTVHMSVNDNFISSARSLRSSKAEKGNCLKFTMLRDKSTIFLSLNLLVEEPGSRTVQNKHSGMSPF